MRYGAENFYITEAERHKEVSDSLGVDMAKNIQINFGFSFGNFDRNICVLFLWVTDPILDKAIELIEDWGFKYKTVGFYWVKTNKKVDNVIYYTLGNLRS